jgi:hypothetical protein
MDFIPTDLSCEADAPAALLRLLHGARREAVSCSEIAVAVSQAWDIAGPERHAIAQLAEQADRSGLRNRYHNPAHTRDVLLSWITLATLHQGLPPHGRVELDRAALAAGLMAALGHDLGHDGTFDGGGAADARVKFRLEEIAATRAAAIAADCGAGGAAFLVAAILATDTVDGYAALRRQGHSPMQTVASDVHPGLAALADPVCWLIAAMLHDADLMASAGLSAAEYDYQAALVSQERGGPPETAAAAAERFFGVIARDGFYSPAGAAFAPCFRALRALALRCREGGYESLAATAAALDGGWPEKA